ncbi:hypothetical protein Aspvir_002881 [Aspergillus viridinutans]|uniref:Aminoglycoside phosphotransferase domain-containing protein n=1 Tax=Aspergillus viridinutans TaxID=75553 RepID=A0A9P3CBK9_ASPVI|nr:uncharacterized protein Aspvir_002881 [Aspergillus viridinutans]GIK07224.1 hypothetical protein Aspvir_002881 [Aspergillus viridinutans]
MVNNDGPVRLTPSMIPDSLNFDIKDSSFFRKWSELPSPQDVQAQAKSQHLARAGPDREIHPTAFPDPRPPPVVLEDMDLFVKWGKAVKISEAKTLFALRRLLNGRVPVPEVYGWRTDGDVKYIYMEYIRGQTLEQAWDKLEPDDLVMICRELRTIFDNLRRLEQDPSDPFVGNIARAPLYDRALDSDYIPTEGPFTTAREFHDWFTFLPRRPMPDPYSVPIEPYRYELPDDCAIKFTHSDLHRSNIIITSHRPYRTLAIVDWEQSGWFPAYWEARKAQYSVSTKEEWSARYLPMILDQYDATWGPWDYYTTSLGC